MDRTQPASQAKWRQQGRHSSDSQLKDQTLMTGFHVFNDFAKRDTSVGDFTLKVVALKKARPTGEAK
jgi:hypothetical protein